MYVICTEIEILNFDKHYQAFEVGKNTETITVTELNLFLTQPHL